MRIGWAFPGLLLIGGVTLAQNPAVAEPLANIGTLTCIVDPATAEPSGTERRLSCSLVRTAGTKAQFTGVVKRLDGGEPWENKVMLAWSVMGPSLDTPLHNLEGRYVGKLGADRNASSDVVGLTGGSNSTIQLRPLTIDPSVGINAAMTVLELELSSIRA
jgi:hypothetical protein